MLHNRNCLTIKEGKLGAREMQNNQATASEPMFDLVSCEQAPAGQWSGPTDAVPVCSWCSRTLLNESKHGILLKRSETHHRGPNQADSIHQRGRRSFIFSPPQQLWGAQYAILCSLSRPNGPTVTPSLLSSSGIKCEHQSDSISADSCGSLSRCS